MLMPIMAESWGLTAVAMLLLSIPFVFGSVRAARQRLVLAAMLGMSVYLFDQIVANAGLLLRMNPAIVALVPGLMLITLAVSGCDGCRS